MKYTDTKKVADPLKFQVGTALIDHSTGSPIPVRVELYRQYSGEADFTVQGLEDREFIMNYIYDSHDYTGDGPDMLPLTYARPRKAE